MIFKKVREICQINNNKLKQYKISDYSKINIIIYLKSKKK